MFNKGRIIQGFQLGKVFFCHDHNPFRPCFGDFNIQLLMLMLSRPDSVIGSAVGLEQTEYRLFKKKEAN